jgi:hypothetical protein
MSEPHKEHVHVEFHEQDSVIDRYWPVGLIAFGISAIMILVFFNPVH